MLYGKRVDGYNYVMVSETGKLERLERVANIYRRPLVLQNLNRKISLEGKMVIASGE